MLSAKSIVMPYPLAFNGATFVRRAALARWMAVQTGRSLDACRVMLRSYDDDPAMVLTRYQVADHRVYAKIGLRVFRNRREFVRHLCALLLRSERKSRRLA